MERAETTPTQVRQKKSQIIPVNIRKRIVEILIQQINKKGKPNRVLISQTAKDFEVSRKSVGRLLKKAKEQLEKGEVINVQTKMVGRPGKRVKVDEAQLKAIPLNRRTNIRSLAKALGISKSTTHRIIRRGDIKAHTNAVKPFLTAENRKKRLEFYLSKLQPNNSILDPKFEDMYNLVHIDEKWFYLSKTAQRYYLHPAETVPLRSCKSKRFIVKVMFMAVVARPRFGEDGEVLFDGKLGIFPFIVNEPAKRKSKNRAAGVMEMKAMHAIHHEK